MAKKSFGPGTMIDPLPAAMVSCGSMSGEKNIITVAWTGIINSEPPMAYVSIRKSRYSHDMIEKNMEFVINLPTAGMARKVDWCGMHSGRDVDKFREMELTPAAAVTVAAPLIKECPVNVECRVDRIVELPSHDMFVAHITEVDADEEAVSGSGKIEMGRIGLLAYNHGEYFGLAKEPEGRFGFSVMKAKTKKRLSKEAHMERVRRNREKRRR